MMSASEARARGLGCSRAVILFVPALMALYGGTAVTLWWVAA